MSDLRCSFRDSQPTRSYHISEMKTLHFVLLLSFALFSNAEPPTTKSPTAKNTRTVDKETSYVPKKLVNSPTNFGFVPTKTSENYVQKEPLGRYVYPDLLGQTQAYVSKYPNYERSQISYQLQPMQYAQQQAVPSFIPAGTHATQQYVFPQQYFHNYQPSQDFSQHLEYQFGHPQLTQYYQEPAGKALNYISANSHPQYVYLQESSNSIENVISPKDQGVRFIMFIPQYVPQHSIQQNYYTPQQTTGQDYTTISQKDEQVQYTYNTEAPSNYQKEPNYQKQPTSLLDSYVPSALQIQYYNKLHAQSQSNQIDNNVKQGSDSAKNHGKEK